MLLKKGSAQMLKVADCSVIGLVTVFGLAQMKCKQLARRLLQIAAAEHIGVLTEHS